MRRRGWLRWFTFESRGERWTVYLVQSIPGARQLWGVTYYQRRAILVHVAQPLSEIPRSTLHEMMHVARGEDDGEAFILATEGELLAVLSQLGLSLPSFPPEFPTLRAEALANEVA